MTNNTTETVQTGSETRAGYRSLNRRRLMLTALTGALVLHLTSGRAWADDFDRLLQSASAGDTVQVLVTGWRAITGNEISIGTQGTGPVAITGDEFVRKLEAASSRVSVTRRYRNFPVLALEVDANALQAAKAAGSGIEVWDDPILEPLLQESTHLVGAPQVWQRGYSGHGRAVVVIDDGVDTRHPFLADRTVFEACFADVCPNGKRAMYGRGAAQPVGTHGTHVAGIAVGRLMGEMVGVAPNLRLVAINVANRRREGMSGSSILAALDTTLRLAHRYPGVIGAVNMSLGGPRNEYGHCRSRIWDLAARLFNEAGVAVVVASGNSSRGNYAAPVAFPACVEGFVSVGAVTKSQRVASLSSSGPALDVLAPGKSSRASVTSNGRHGFQEIDGTSMATPHVAAAMSLLHQALPNHSVADRLRMLQRTGQMITDSRNGIRAASINIGRVFEQLERAAVPEEDAPFPGEMTLGPDNSDSAPPSPKLPAPRPPKAPEPPKQNPGQWRSITG